LREEPGREGGRGTRAAARSCQIAGSSAMSVGMVSWLKRMSPMVIGSFGLCWMAWPVVRNATAGVLRSVSAMARTQLIVSTATNAARQRGRRSASRQ